MNYQLFFGKESKELKAFKKIALKTGESRDISFTITENDLKFYNTDLNYAAEPGTFKVFVGDNSRDVLETSFVLEKYNLVYFLHK